MELPTLPSRRICAGCKFWVPNFVGPQTIGWCTWKESLHKWHQPRMNGGSKFTLYDNGKLLETHWDASCIQFQEK